MLKRALRSHLFLSFLSWLLAGYFKLVHATSRIEYLNLERVEKYIRPGLPIIVTFWHGQVAMVAFARPRHHPIHILISRHGDGELIARVMARMGVNAVRGSTEKKGRAVDKGGARAVRVMTRILRHGGTVGITPDGPRGPRMRVSPGTITLARLSGAPLFPLIYAASRRRILKSWDRFLLPLPFSRGLYVFGELIEVPRRGDAALFEAKRRELETVMNALSAEADRRLGNDPVLPAAEAAMGP